jgi:hypothetical protein
MSRSFGDKVSRRPHLVRAGKGGVAGEIGDLRRDIEEAFVSLEAEVEAGGGGVGNTYFPDVSIQSPYENSIQVVGGLFKYQVVGYVVTVSGILDIDPGGEGGADITFSLPVDPVFMVSGIMVHDEGVAATIGEVQGEGVRAYAYLSTTGNGTKRWCVHLTYLLD